MNKSYQTYSRSFISTVANKWANENIASARKICIKVKLQLSPFQRDTFNEWFGTSNYVFNKALDKIKVDKVQTNEQLLRDMLVTSKTKENDPEYHRLCESEREIKAKIKGLDSGLQLENLRIQLEQVRKQKRSIAFSCNDGVEEWELRTPKDIRYNAIRDLIKAYSATWEKVKKGQIPHFEMKYRKKTEHNSIVLEPNQICLQGNQFQIMPQFLGEHSGVKVARRCLQEMKMYRFLHARD